MSSAELKDLEQKCKKAVEHFKTELSRVRGGRATTALLEGVTVEYYGSQVPLRQMGQVNAPEPRLLTIQVFDTGAMESVEKAIQQAGLGLNPMRDGNLVRVPIPALTEERRKELIKKLHKTAEDSKVAVRNLRRDTITVLEKKEKDRALSQDELKREKEAVQKIIDKSNQDIDAVLAAKEKEMMEV